MSFDRAEATFWAAFLRNRNVDAGTAGDGAIPVAGGYAVYVAGTALTYAMGAGSARPLREDDCTAAEDFYGARAQPSRFELDEAVLARDEALLHARGYTDEDLVLRVLCGPAAATPPKNGRIAVRTTTDRRAWTDLAMLAHAEAAVDAPTLRRTLQTAAAAAQVLVIASLDGQDAGVGTVSLVGELGLLMGAAVLPALRGRGIYAALLAARLGIAHARGATRGALKTTPDSPVERSALRAGFQPAELRRRVRREPV